MNNSPWIARFNIVLSDAELDRLIEIRAVPVKVGKDTPHTDAETLQKGLERVFMSGIQVRKVLRQLLDLARSQAGAHFSSKDAFITGVYKPFPWGSTTSPAICFCGLAGVGKSQILGALTRILPPPTLLDVLGHKNISLVSAWPMTLRDGMSLNALLKPYLKSSGGHEEHDDEGTEAGKVTKDIKLPTLLGLARRRSWRDGVCLLWVDEFQFVSQGSQANSKATALLLQLLGIGPRLVFVANFSLGHKLKRRNQEDRQRLVAQPWILDPEICSSADWKAIIAEYKKVAPDVFAFEVDEAESLIHELTFGIKRLVVQLLVCAYKEARKRGKYTVGVDEIRQAYKSSLYTSNREDVEILWRQCIGKKMIQEDLWCPFDQTHDDVTAMEEIGTNVTFAQKAIDSFETKIEDQLLDSSLLPSEKAAVQKLEPFNKDQQRPGMVIHIRRPKATKQSLQEACDLFDE